MTIKLYEPEPAIKEFVSQIAIYKHDGDYKGQLNSLNIYADGFPGIIFQRSPDNNMYLLEDGKRLASLFLYGQTVKPVTMQTSGAFDIILFFLRPHSIKSLLGINANELTDTCVDISILNKFTIPVILDQLYNANSVELQISTLSSFFKGLIAKNRPFADNKLIYAIEAIQKSKGEISLPELQNQLNITERTFQRKFEQFVGVSPKLYARIFRFQNSLTQIQTNQFKKLTDIAFENGYADQSHFIRNFKEFTGKLPNDFQKIHH